MPLPILVPAFAAAVVAAVTVRPESVPARGQRESVVTLDRAAMVHLTATSASGTACEIIDHQRGPFASSGEAGVTNCSLDLLLDAGSYKLRLSSSRKGKGTATVKAAPFAEINTPALRVDPRREVQTLLKPGQTASYWIHLDKRQGVNLRVLGRTAGLVRLWRNGEWLENVPFQQTNPSPRRGQPIHQWQLGATLEAGDYLLVAYGSSPQRWTNGTEDDTLFVAHGFPLGPPSRSVAFTLPASGHAAFELPKGPAVAFLNAVTLGGDALSLVLHGLDAEGRLAPIPQASCRVEAKAQIPQCGTRSHGNLAQVAIVRGAPGAKGDLAWARAADGGLFQDGLYGNAPELRFKPAASGTFLVSAHEIPLDRDAAPLSCLLSIRRPQGSEILARDLLPIAPERPVEKAFNYNGREETLWFEVEVAGKYRLTTSGGRGSHCELYRVDSTDRQRLAQSAPEEQKACNLSISLNAGPHELKLYRGTEGIERLRISGTADAGSPPTVGTGSSKLSCLIAGQHLEKDHTYSLALNRRGRSDFRGLHLRPLPLTLEDALPLALEPASVLRLPIAAGRPVVVRGAGSFSCAIGSGPEVPAEEGACRLPENQRADTLVLRSRAPETLALSVQRPLPPPSAPPPLATFSPTFAPLPRLELDKLQGFSFDREQSHSLLFEVKEAGLHHVTTEGLLATECRIRTPVVPWLATDTEGGRGRNCLVAEYLRPGRYMLTVKTTGQSRGRAQIRLTRRPPVETPPLTADGEVYFRAAAGDLLRQRLAVRVGGTYLLSSGAQGAELSCRLDDKNGWPVVAVPTPCTGPQTLAAGQYLWTQLPLTVESQRRTKIERVRPTRVLFGEKTHPLAFNTVYNVKLGKDGKDEFLLDVPAAVPAQVLLTHGMQGRLYRALPDGTLRPEHVIPPRPDSSDSVDEPSEDSEEPIQDERPVPESDASEGEGDGEGIAPPPPVPPPRPPPRLGGEPIALEAGRYKLVAEHSRGDVAISYRLHVGTETLIPGVSLDLQIPRRTELRMPTSGILRLRTEGEADVRCRIFDRDGRLVAESSDNGADWNCALAEPLPAGDYTLDLESETQRPHNTRVTVTTPALEDKGELADGRALAVSGSVVSMALPKGEREAVQEVAVRAATPFSCALMDEKGSLLFRKMQARDCSFQLRPSGETHRLRLWTLNLPAQVQVAYAARPIGVSLFGKISVGEAARVSIERAGRFRTSPGVSCLSEPARGILRPCGPEVSLEAGPVVFTGFGPKVAALLPLDEIVMSLDEPRSEILKLSRAPFLQVQRTKKPAVHLLSVKVAAGERAPPACEIASGAWSARDDACHAASGRVTESLLRVWAPDDRPVAAAVTRVAVPFEEVASLAYGKTQLEWKGPSLALSLPDEPARVDLVLPSQTFAVLLDEQGAAVDLCPPDDDLSRCVLASAKGAGKTIVLSSPEKRAEATLLRMPSPPKAIRLAGQYEAIHAEPGSLRFEVPAESKARSLEVLGAARCVTVLGDGTRNTRCNPRVPVGAAATLMVDYDRGPLRVTALPEGGEAEARLFSSESRPPPVALAKDQALPLRTPGDFSFSLASDAVVHLESESGVCGLFAGAAILDVSGFAAGCEIHRLLSAGTYRLRVRPFAGQPLSGNISYRAEGAPWLSEGVGAERWIDPAGVQVFRFRTASKGHVGVGMQVSAETLSCTVRDAGHRPIGDGCHQFLLLDEGSYSLEVRAERSTRPLRYRPVLLGLAGAQRDVPEEYLREFFSRIGEQR